MYTYLYIYVNKCNIRIYLYSQLCSICIYIYIHVLSIIGDTDVPQSDLLFEQYKTKTNELIKLYGALEARKVA